MKGAEKSIKNMEADFTPPPCLQNLNDNEEFVKPYAEAAGLTEDEARSVLSESAVEVERVEGLLNDKLLEGQWKEE